MTIDVDDPKLKAMIEQTSAIATAVTGTSINGAAVPSFASASGGVTLLDSLTCSPGSECYKTKRTALLKKNFDSKTKTYNDAPLDLSRAEKNYYVYNQGEPGGEDIYNELIIDRFATTGTMFKKNSIEKQQQFMAELIQSIKQYQSAILFQKQMNNLLKLRQDEQNKLTKYINYYQTILQTSERKVVYENKNMDSLYIYRRIMIFLYYAGLVCFIVFGNFIPDKLYTQKSVWFIILIVAIIPIIMNIVIMWLFILYDTVSYWFADLPHKDVYFNLGGNPPRPPTK
jgi:hypothetical protein